MPEDIEKMVDDFLDEAPTLEYEAPPEIWHILGADAEDLTLEEEAELVADACGTASTKEPWYEKLMRELGE